ncbi:hypothetical protein Tco_1127615 [Tanacetum coccineum]
MCASTPEEVAYMKKVPYASANPGNTRDMFLVYEGKPDTELNVTGFCDASWQCDKDDTKSWSDAFNKKPIDMYCDNSAAIIFANDSGVMKGARHFLRRYHYVREQVESGEIKILKVHIDDNLADHFTKALPRGKVTDHANGIGLQLASNFMHTCD